MGMMLITDLYIVVVVIWIASFIYRSAQKKVRRASFLMGALLIGWAIMHLLKYQTESSPVLSRYIWYSYAFFELALPLVLLWLAYGLDKPDGKAGIPHWMRVLFVINGAIAALCMTNDFHLFVHSIDIDSPYWMLDYGYGAGFYIWMAGWLLPFLASIIIMLIKIGVYVRKRMLLFLGFFFALLLVYQHGYVNRIPIIWESDRIIVNGIFALLLVESIMRSGLIPVNTKYRTLFTRSPLKLQIMSSAGDYVLSSASVEKYDSDEVMSALASHPCPVLRDENTLMFAKQIIGGYAIWQEDISSLNRLHKETEESVAKLKAANVILAKEEKIKRAAQEENAKTQLMAQLESEIIGHTIKLSAMIEQIENVTDRPKAMARITLLLCYVKRRCNLLFSENEAEALQADELTAHFEELAEIAGFSDVRAIISSGVKTKVPVRCATLLYDFFYNVIHWATWAERQRILVYLSIENENIVLRLIPSEDVRSFHMEKSLVNAIVSAGGTYEVKNLDDAFSISLTFPEGGEGDA